MSDDKKNGLGDLVKNLQAGFNGLKSGSKNKADPAEPTLAAGAANSDATPRDQADFDDHDDLLATDVSADATDSKQVKRAGGLSNLSSKKKILLAAVCLVAFVLVKNAAFSPKADSTPIASTEQPTNKSGELALDFGKPETHQAGSDESALPTSPLGLQPKEDDAVGKTLDELNLDGPFQVKEEKGKEALANKGTPEPAALDAFGFPSTPGNATTPGNPSTVVSSVQPATTVPTPATPPVAADMFAANTNSAPAIGSDPKPESNPFGQQPAAPGQAPEAASSAPTMLGKPAPVLAGTQTYNPDSSTQPRLQANNSAELASIGAQLKIKDELIQSLEKQLQNAKNDVPKKGRTLAAKQKVRAPSKHASPFAKRTSPQATPVATLSARPRVCVKAVAQAARNCSTCVAHAFIVDSGTENMVGQGDFIHGYRVSITGDRLDLQNSDGQVMHKFWSSSNGCPAF